MFTQSDLFTLVNATPGRGVSIYLPTHVSGRETRQDPIRFENLLSEAHRRLVAEGARAHEADAVLAPGTALLDDLAFWRHQDQGLAFFLGADGSQYRYTVPLSFTEEVRIEPGFYVKPLLPLLATDGEFAVLTMTGTAAHLYDAAKFAMVEDRSADLPAPQSPQTHDLDAADRDEWVGKVAKAVDTHLADRAIPLVVIADPELSGQFTKHSTLGELLAHTIDTNPAALDADALHALAYQAIRPRFESHQRATLDRAAQLLADSPTKVAVTIGEVVRSAFQGRVDALLLTAGSEELGRFDEMADAVETFSEPGTEVIDLTEYATVRTLENKGSVYIFEPEELAALFKKPHAPASIAVLRF